MGTHPIFESDFDCLTEATRTARLQSFDWDEIIMDVENQGAADVQAPTWMLWAARIGGILAAFLWIFAGIWNFVKIITFQWNCVVASVLAFIFAIVILTIEATPLTAWGPCAPYTEKLAEKTQAFKYWQRTIFYAFANVAVFLLTMLVAFIYGFIVFKHKRMTGDLA